MLIVAVVEQPVRNDRIGAATGIAEPRPGGRANVFASIRRPEHNKKVPGRNVKRQDDID
jgi:hypothetical protein